MSGRIARRSLVTVAALVMAAAGMATAGASSAWAYGAADQPVAQVELSGNCTNPSFPLCFPEDQGGVGLGGVWAWAELDSDTGSATATDPSPMDATIAFCGHVLGGGGPGSAGGGGGPDRIGDWYRVSSVNDAFAVGAFPFFDTSQQYASYYVLDFFPGSGSDDFIVVVPGQVGHYSLHPARGVSLQTQVAP